MQDCQTHFQDGDNRNGWLTGRDCGDRCENSHVCTTNTFSTVCVVTFLIQATEIMKDAQQNLLFFEKDKSCLLLEF